MDKNLIDGVSDDQRVLMNRPRVSNFFISTESSFSSCTSSSKLPVKYFFFSFDRCVFVVIVVGVIRVLVHSMLDLVRDPMSLVVVVVVAILFLFFVSWLCFRSSSIIRLSF